MGSPDGALLELPMPPTTPVMVPDESAPSEEELVFATPAPVTVRDRRWGVKVTSRRIILHRTEGLVFQKTAEQVIDPAGIRAISLREEGTIMKEYFLQVDGLLMSGKKSDLGNLYSAIQFVRKQAGGTG